MGAVASKTVADLRRRRLQTVVLALVLFLGAGAATLALSILVETNEPFDHAFAAANGAHLVIDYDATVSEAQLDATKIMISEPEIEMLPRRGWGLIVDGDLVTDEQRDAAAPAIILDEMRPQGAAVFTIDNGAAGGAGVSCRMRSAQACCRAI